MISKKSVPGDLNEFLRCDGEGRFGGDFVYFGEARHIALQRVVAIGSTGASPSSDSLDKLPRFSITFLHSLWLDGESHCFSRGNTKTQLSLPKAYTIEYSRR